MQIAPPSDFVIWIQKRASCGLQKTPKSVIGRGLCPEPRWGSWRDEAPPDLPVGCGRVTPPHTPSHAAPTHLRRSPCVPPEFQPQLRLCWQLCYTVIAIYQTHWIERITLYNIQGSHYILILKFKDFQGPWSCIFKDQF